MLFDLPNVIGEVADLALGTSFSRPFTRPDLRDFWGEAAPASDAYRATKEEAESHG